MWVWNTMVMSSALHLNLLLSRCTSLYPSCHIERWLLWQHDIVTALTNACLSWWSTDQKFHPSSWLLLPLPRLRDQDVGYSPSSHESIAIIVAVLHDGSRMCLFGPYLQRGSSFATLSKLQTFPEAHAEVFFRYRHLIDSINDTDTKPWGKRGIKISVSSPKPVTKSSFLHIWSEIKGKSLQILPPVDYVMLARS